MGVTHLAYVQLVLFSLFILFCFIMFSPCAKKILLSMMTIWPVIPIEFKMVLQIVLNIHTINIRSYWRTTLHRHKIRHILNSRHMSATGSPLSNFVPTLHYKLLAEGIHSYSGESFLFALIFLLSHFFNCFCVLIVFTFIISSRCLCRVVWCLCHKRVVFVKCM